MSLVLSFSALNNFHPGHAVYLRPAASLGAELFVVMARDVNVERIKNKKARQTEDQIRKKVTEFLQQQGIKGKAVFGYD